MTEAKEMIQFSDLLFFFIFKRNLMKLMENGKKFNFFDHYLISDNLKEYSEQIASIISIDGRKFAKKSNLHVVSLVNYIEITITEAFRYLTLCLAATALKVPLTQFNQIKYNGT